MMVRKDAEKEVERPHYYSQFWLDVAAGRKVIGSGRSSQETEDVEPVEMESSPETVVKGGKTTRSPATSPVVDVEPPVQRAPAAHQPVRLSGSESLADLAAVAGLVDMEEGEEPSDLAGADFAEEEEALPGVQTDFVTEPDEETINYSDLYEEEEAEEEAEEEEWPSRRGKKPRRPEKPRRREKGRDF